MKVKIITVLLLFVTIFSFYACKKDIYFEGEICDLQFQEEYTMTLLLPVNIYTGKTHSVILVPYIRRYPDRYYVKTKTYNEEKENYEYNECYVTKDCFEKLEIGQWFVYDKTYCFEEEPYIQEKA